MFTAGLLRAAPEVLVGLRDGLAFDISHEFCDLMLAGSQAEFNVLTTECVNGVVERKPVKFGIIQSQRFHKYLLGELSLVIHQVVKNAIQSNRPRVCYPLVIHKPVFNPQIIAQLVCLPNIFDCDHVGREIDLLEVYCWYIFYQ